MVSETNCLHALKLLVDREKKVDAIRLENKVRAWLRVWGMNEPHLSWEDGVLTLHGVHILGVNEGLQVQWKAGIEECFVDHYECISKAERLLEVIEATKEANRPYEYQRRKYWLFGPKVWVSVKRTKYNPYGD